MLDATSERTGIGGQVQQTRQPGLSIVLIQQDGGKLVAYEPPSSAPLIEGVPAHDEVATNVLPDLD
jgi:hypothetical protein